MKKVLVGVTWTAWLVWLLAASYHGYQYALRLAGEIMRPQLSETYHLTSAGTAFLAGIFYIGFCLFSLVAGAGMDRFGARGIISIGAVMAGTGALLFGSGNLGVAGLGRFLQGAGGVVALVGAIYIVSRLFPQSHTATFIGVTQMFGMAGGWSGQAVARTMIAQGLSWNKFWMGMGLAGLFIAVTLFVFLPPKKSMSQPHNLRNASANGLGIVLRNPQTILCGLIASLLFIPTTTLDMIWGTHLLQELRGFEYGDAVIHSTTFALGWVLGCPLWGLLSDYIGRRKPLIMIGSCVLLICLAWLLYGRPDVFPADLLGLIAGLASGASMLTYSVIREANPPEWTGTATGVMNFMNITFVAIAVPMLGLVMRLVSESSAMPARRDQWASVMPLFGVVLAIVLSFGLKETRHADRVPHREKEAA